MERVPMLNKNSLEVVNFVGLDKVRIKSAQKKRTTFFKMLTALLIITFFVWVGVR